MKINTLNRFLQPNKTVVIRKGASLGPSESFRKNEIIRDVIDDNHKRLYLMSNLLVKHFR